MNLADLNQDGEVSFTEHMLDLDRNGLIDDDDGGASGNSNRHASSIGDGCKKGCARLVPQTCGGCILWVLVLCFIGLSLVAIIPSCTELVIHDVTKSVNSVLGISDNSSQSNAANVVSAMNITSTNKNSTGNKTESASNSGKSSNESNSAESSDSSAATSTNSTSNTYKKATAEDVSDQLPYVGMSVSLIDSTWLGEHDDFEMVTMNRNDIKGEADEYMWRSKNGKDELVFAAYVQKGEVAHIAKFLTGTDYWPELFGMPDLYASGTKKSSTSSATKPDPADYDDPDEYDDDLKAYQEATGDLSSNYDDQYDEWDLDH